MKEFVEKLIGRLEEYPTYSFGVSLLNTQEYIKVSDLIEIVNQLAEEYINCSTNISTDKTKINDNDLMIVESLPSLYPMKEFEEEALQRVIECVKNEYNNGWIACSERLPEIGKWVLGQGVYDMMLVCYTKSYGGDFDWMDINGDCRVISAWQPLPEPYQKGE